MMSFMSRANEAARAVAEAAGKQNLGVPETYMEERQLWEMAHMGRINLALIQFWLRTANEQLATIRRLAWAAVILLAIVALSAGR